MNESSRFVLVLRELLYPKGLMCLTIIYLGPKVSQKGGIYQAQASIGFRV